MCSSDREAVLLGDWWSSDRSWQLEGTKYCWSIESCSTAVMVLSSCSSLLSPSMWGEESVKQSNFGLDNFSLVLEGKAKWEATEGREENQNLPSDWGRVRQLREFDNSVGGEYYSCSCPMHWSDNMLMRKDTQPHVWCTHGMHNIRNTEVTFCSI
jgi:hypothetical protein